MLALSSLLGHAEVVDWRMVAMVAITWCQILCRACHSVDLCVSLSMCVSRNNDSAAGHQLFSLLRLNL